MNSKKDLYYSKTHEWINIEDNIATVGLSDYAQKSLGDIVFVELPEMDEHYDSGQECAVIESVKAASDIYCPLNGIVEAINESLEDTPEDINESPFETWIFKLKLDENYKEELKNLMSYDDYKDFLEKEEN